VERVWIIGCSGSGKSTLAAAVAERLGLRHHELDGIFHQPGWTQMPDDEFLNRVTAITVGDRWILDGNYFVRTGGAPVGRVQTVVWLDLPRLATLRRVTQRTLRRVVQRQELWNGNREPLSNLYRFNSPDNLIRWSWSQHPVYRERYSQALASGAFGDADVVRLTSQAEVDRWLRSLTPAGMNATDETQ